MYGHFFECFCSFTLESDIVRLKVAYDADDAHVVVYLYVAELLELVDDGVEVGCVVDGDADAYLGGGDHVDGSLVCLKDFEYFAQEAVGEQHA